MVAPAPLSQPGAAQRLGVSRRRGTGPACSPAWTAALYTPSGLTEYTRGPELHHSGDAIRPDRLCPEAHHGITPSRLTLSFDTDLLRLGATLQFEFGYAGDQLQTCAQRPSGCKPPTTSVNPTFYPPSSSVKSRTAIGQSEPPRAKPWAHPDRHTRLTLGFKTIMATLTA